MGNVGALGLCVVLGVAAACGGPETHMPPRVVDAVKITDDAYEAGDRVAQCTAVQTVLLPAMYEWQEHARGKFTQIVYMQASALESVAMGCVSPTGINDVERWKRWRADTEKMTRMKSNWGTVLKWLLLPLALFVAWVGIRRFAPV